MKADRLVSITQRMDNLVWISPGNPSSRRCFESLASARKTHLLWEASQSMAVPLVPRGPGRTWFLCNPLRHIPGPDALAPVAAAFLPGDRLALLLPEEASANNWLHEACRIGFEPLGAHRVAQGPGGGRAALHLFRLAVPWQRRHVRLPSLSIIIPARNEAGTLSHLLDRLTGLDGVETEVVFVEGHSRDDTWRAIERARERYAGPWRLRALRQPGRGRSDAVHWGLSHGEGQVLAVLDADMSVPPESLRRFYDAFVEGRGDLIYGDRFRLPMEPGAMGGLGRLGNQCLARGISSLAGQTISDVTCGTKLLSAQDYREILRWRARASTWDSLPDFDLLLGGAALGLKLLGLPVSFKSKGYGRTPLRRLRVGFQLLLHLVRGAMARNAR